MNRESHDSNAIHTIHGVIEGIKRYRNLYVSCKVIFETYRDMYLTIHTILTTNIKTTSRKKDAYLDSQPPQQPGLFSLHLQSPLEASPSPEPWQPTSSPSLDHAHSFLRIPSSHTQWQP